MLGRKMCTVDAEELTSRARQMWALGDYGELATLLQPGADELVHAAMIGPGQRVLDVAAGTGNVAVIAAQRGGQVTATDLTPQMVELGRERTRAAGLNVDWGEADAEDLPFPNGAFDTVLSAFGVIHVARPAVAVRELRRVLRPGGTLAFTSWVAGGYLHRTIEEMRRWAPPPPGSPDAFSWGDEAGISARLSGEFDDIHIRRAALTWMFPSLTAMTEYWRTVSPSHVAASNEAGSQAAEMFAAVEELTRPHTAPDGAVTLAVEYLIVVARAI